MFEAAFFTAGNPDQPLAIHPALQSHAVTLITAVAPGTCALPPERKELLTVLSRSLSGHALSSPFLRDTPEAMLAFAREPGQPVVSKISVVDFSAAAVAVAALRTSPARMPGAHHRGRTFAGFDMVTISPAVPSVELLLLEGTTALRVEYSPPASLALPPVVDMCIVDKSHGEVPPPNFEKVALNHRLLLCWRCGAQEQPRALPPASKRPCPGRFAPAVFELVDLEAGALSERESIFALARSCAQFVFPRGARCRQATALSSPITASSPESIPAPVLTSFATTDSTGSHRYGFAVVFYVAASSSSASLAVAPRGLPSTAVAESPSSLSRVHSRSSSMWTKSFLAPIPSPVAAPDVFMQTALCLVSKYPVAALAHALLRFAYERLVDACASEQLPASPSTNNTNTCSDLRVCPLPRRATTAVQVMLQSVQRQLRAGSSHYFPNDAPPRALTVKLLFPSLRCTYDRLYACDTRAAFETFPALRSLPAAGAGRFVMLLKCLSPCNIVKAVELLLLEQRVVVHCYHAPVLMPVLEALRSVMFPLQWRAPYIPVCAAGLLELLECPTAFFIGIPTSLLPISLPEDVFLVDLDRDRVTKGYGEEAIVFVDDLSGSFEPDVAFPGGDGPPPNLTHTATGRHKHSYGEMLSPQAVVPNSLRKSMSAGAVTDAYRRRFVLAGAASGGEGSSRVSEGLPLADMVGIDECGSDSRVPPIARIQCGDSDDDSEASACTSPVHCGPQPCIFPVAFAEFLCGRLCAIASSAGFRPGVGADASYYYAYPVDSVTEILTPTAGSSGSSSRSVCAPWPLCSALSSAEVDVSHQRLCHQSALEDIVAVNVRDCFLRVMCRLLLSYREHTVWMPISEVQSGSSRIAPCSSAAATQCSPSGSSTGILSPLGDLDLLFRCTSQQIREVETTMATSATADIRIRRSQSLSIDSGLLPAQVVVSAAAQSADKSVSVPDIQRIRVSGAAGFVSPRMRQQNIFLGPNASQLPKGRVSGIGRTRCASSSVSVLVDSTTESRCVAGHLDEETVAGTSKVLGISELSSTIAESECESAVFVFDSAKFVDCAPCHLQLFLAQVVQTQSFTSFLQSTSWEQTNRSPPSLCRAGDSTTPNYVSSGYCLAEPSDRESGLEEEGHLHFFDRCVSFLQRWPGARGYGPQLRLLQDIVLYGPAAISVEHSRCVCGGEEYDDDHSGVGTHRFRWSKDDMAHSFTMNNSDGDELLADNYGVIRAHVQINPILQVDLREFSAVFQSSSPVVCDRKDSAQGISFAVSESSYSALPRNISTQHSVEDADSVVDHMELRRFSTISMSVTNSEIRLRESPDCHIGRDDIVDRSISVHALSGKPSLRIRIQNPPSPRSSGDVAAVLVQDVPKPMAGDAPQCLLPSQQPCSPPTSHHSVSDPFMSRLSTLIESLRSVIDSMPPATCALERGLRAAARTIDERIIDAHAGSLASGNEQGLSSESGENISHDPNADAISIGTALSMHKSCILAGAVYFNRALERDSGGGGPFSAEEAEMILSNCVASLSVADSLRRHSEFCTSSLPRIESCVRAVSIMARILLEKGPISDDSTYALTLDKMDDSCVRPYERFGRLALWLSTVVCRGAADSGNGDSNVSAETLQCILSFSMLAEEYCRGERATSGLHAQSFTEEAKSSHKPIADSACIPALHLHAMACWPAHSCQQCHNVASRCFDLTAGSEPTNQLPILYQEELLLSTAEFHFPSVAADAGANGTHSISSKANSLHGSWRSSCGFCGSRAGVRPYVNMSTFCAVENCDADELCGCWVGRISNVVAYRAVDSDFSAQHSKSPNSRASSVTRLGWQSKKRLPLLFPAELELELEGLLARPLSESVTECSSHLCRVSVSAVWWLRRIQASERFVEAVVAAALNGTDLHAQSRLRLGFGMSHRTAVARCTQGLYESLSESVACAHLHKLEVFPPKDTPSNLQVYQNRFSLHVHALADLEEELQRGLETVNARSQKEIVHVTLVQPETTRLFSSATNTNPYLLLSAHPALTALLPYLSQRDIVGAARTFFNFRMLGRQRTASSFGVVTTRTPLRALCTDLSFRPVGQELVFEHSCYEVLRIVAQLHCPALLTCSLASYNAHRTGTGRLDCNVRPTTARNLDSRLSAHADSVSVSFVRQPEIPVRARCNGNKPAAGDCIGAASLLFGENAIHSTDPASGISNGFVDRPLSLVNLMALYPTATLDVGEADEDTPVGAPPVSVCAPVKVAFAAPKPQGWRRWLTRVQAGSVVAAAPAAKVHAAAEDLQGTCVPSLHHPLASSTSEDDRWAFERAVGDALVELLGAPPAISPPAPSLNPACEASSTHASGSPIAALSAGISGCMEPHDWPPPVSALLFRRLLGQVDT